MPSAPLTADLLGEIDGDRTLGDVMPQPMLPPSRPPRPDGDPVNPAGPARRRAAEAAARAAEARATAAAAEAKAAIAAAARAAAAADAAAQAAEEAAEQVAREIAAQDRAVQHRAAQEAAVRTERVRAEGVLDATQPVAMAPRPGGSERTVPAPRRAPGHRARPDEADGDRPITTALAQAGDPVTAVFPALAPAVRDAERPTGRRAARRAAEADETTVLAADDAADDDAEEAAEQAPRRRRREEEPAAAAEASTRAERRRAAARSTPADERGRVIAPRRRLRPPVLVAAAVGGVLVLGGVAFGTGVIGAPQQAAVVSAPVPALPGPGTEQEPAAAERASTDGAALSNQATEYLEQLRDAGVPTSRAGTAEVEAAELVCEELADGLEPEQLARALPASLPTVSRSQAADLIEVAQEYYCE